MTDQPASSVLQDYEWMEFERWVKIEYPDISEEFTQLPKTFIDFADRYYSYLFQEFIDDRHWEACGLRVTLPPYGAGYVG